ncbi:MAG TPA: cupin domain-containing protein [Thermoleophilaceae bacterium]|nr:cupin domain-containing protein [Thermoleophilaceae bacterium]
MSTDPTAFVLAHDEGEALWFFGTLALVRLPSEGTGLCLVEQFAPRGMATPLHRQPDDAETFYVLEGEATFHAGGTTRTVGPGGTVHVPAGVEHAFRVDAEPSRILVLTTAQHEAFFRAAGEPAQDRVLPPAGPPDMAKVEAAASRYGVEILGPPPF